MASRLSGSPKDRELVVIETTELTCVIKGPAEHPQYGKLRGYNSLKVEDYMKFQCRAENIITIQIYDVITEELKLYSGQEFIPVFFENGQYEVIIIPKTEDELTFYHEYPQFREAITKVSRVNLLTGILHFRNEVGLTSFEILDSRNRRLVDVMLEIFPAKLDYKKDYKALLNEVSEEIYNLAYHFIKRTYLQGSAKIYKDPSLTEFYRLMQLHYEQYIRAVDRIEIVSHHQLQKHYIEVRGSQLRKPDQRTLAYLRRNSSKFVDVPNGIPIGDRTVMPSKGLLLKKEHTADTHENRYVKWTMARIITRLKELKRVIEGAYTWGYSKLDNELIGMLDQMISGIEKRQKNMFWRTIGKLDRSIISLVLQMAPGYREVLVVYTTISKSIILQGEIYKMSVKDIATLYEYWTFLKLGQLLAEKCVQVSQDVVKVNTEGLFVNLDKSRTAERKYIHPVTGEEITLKYQYDTSSNRVPTVQQKPDSMLSIGKKGKDYQYQYVFDAKYRIDFETSSMPGPMQDDINTMHRYRDSIVVNTSGSYERTAFGAYVLFPWHDEMAYKNHPLYRSIDSVNIGGLPFLPNHTTLVDRFIDSLLNKSPEELQQEGILPKGSMEPVEMYSTDYVLVCTFFDNEVIQRLLSTKVYVMKIADLKEGWNRIQFIAVFDNSKNQFSFYSKVVKFEIEDEYIKFTIENWISKKIDGMGYEVDNHAMIPYSSFLQANSLAELHTKNEEELILWKIVNRISNNVLVNLDHRIINLAKRVISFEFDAYRLEMHHDERELLFMGRGFEEKINMDLILDNESYIFQRMVELIYPK
ncbi:DUF2357 domain-containing protein [Sporosarcina sp. UB5]|uniref:DUF2357 domain-containing protein n=1 Tax=Sporosarcina sp. UB5 TaxID=3047463 RepID=UPI003D7AFFB9